MLALKFLLELDINISATSNTPQRHAQRFLLAYYSWYYILVTSVIDFFATFLYSPGPFQLHSLEFKDIYMSAIRSATNNTFLAQRHAQRFLLAN